jgi:hypothetical protein
MHRDIYRETSQRGDLMPEAFAIAGILVLANVLGRAGGLGGVLAGFPLRFVLTSAATTAVAWGCAVFAIRVIARSRYSIDLTPSIWFRPLVYAQAGSLLAIIPTLANITMIWSLVCMTAALSDVTGRDTKTSAVLTLVACVAATIGLSIGGTILR